MRQATSQLQTCRRRARRVNGRQRALTDAQKAARERRRARRARQRAPSGPIPLPERLWPRIPAYNMGYGRVLVERSVPFAVDGERVLLSGCSTMPGPRYITYEPKWSINARAKRAS